ncbi:RING finger protein 122 [Carassius auratus]|uniref:RING finger protein 122 n=1 Tax=Carassius auratus TaxID=7957 RepID=A0A6P6Q9T9_CARAU|nr:RING finger protein 122-like [Carassius auratus]XP_052423870.1 RING finger protein 122 [Carassius gibelio]XP_059395482.1 RING finger protein 122 [Carassius carassius]
MPPVTSQELPLNIYVVIFGTGIFVFVLSLIFCCFFISKLRHQARNVRAGYKMVVFKDETTRLHAHGLTCAVCLEDFRTKDELGVLPCQHAFHKRCLVKWLEVRCSCPMCNSPVSDAQGQTHSTNLLDELL